MPASELLIIDDKLRFVLYGVSVTLNIELRASEIERLFSDSASNDSSARSYEFHRSPRIAVEARIDEYEPESVWLIVTAPKFDQTEMQRLVDAARHASFRLTKHTNESGRPSP